MLHVLKMVDGLEDKLKVPAVKTRETAAETTARDHVEEQKRDKFKVQGLDQLHPSS